MIGEQVTCENPGCGVVFTKKTHNQIYHDSECTRIATNIKIMEKYRDKRKVKLGHARYCAVCETTRLSRYNPDTVCNGCTQKQEIERNQSVGDMLMSVNWLA